MWCYRPSRNRRRRKSPRSQSWRKPLKKPNRSAAPKLRCCRKRSGGASRERQRTKTPNLRRPMPTPMPKLEPNQVTTRAVRKRRRNRITKKKKRRPNQILPRRRTMKPSPSPNPKPRKRTRKLKLPRKKRKARKPMREPKQVTEKVISKEKRENRPAKAREASNYRLAPSPGMQKRTSKPKAADNSPRSG